MTGGSYHLSDLALLAECREEALRAGGPGGQHANRTESGVRLIHVLSGVTAESRTHREKLRNKREALAVLRVRLAITQRGYADFAWLVPHRRGGRVLAGPASAAWPCIVGCLCDALARAEGELPEAARALELTSSQLVKALTADKEVHQAANAVRLQYGKGAIHGR